MNAKEIRELFKSHGLDLSRDDVWEVRPGTPVVLHKALERLGAAIKVKWIDKQIIRCERDEAVILVSGHIGYGSEWSIGEACIGQNYMVKGKMAAYPYAIAEKRAKDRVILKLAGLHGVYSEEEADDFKQGASQPKEPETEMPPIPEEDPREAYVQSFIARIEALSPGQALEYAKIERRDVWREYGIDQFDEYGQKMSTIIRKYTTGAAA